MSCILKWVLKITEDASKKDVYGHSHTENMTEKCPLYP
jgi:hypothetical protein